MIRFSLRRLAVAAAGIAAAAALCTAAAAAPAAPSGQGATAAPAAAPVCQTFAAANTALQTRVVTSSDATIYTSTAWTNLACGATVITAPRGRSVLVVAQVDAEVTCTGADGQWCLGRVLVGNAAGSPAAPEPDSFSWANSEPNATQWESNAFTRTRDLTCPRNFALATCTWRIVAQVRNHATGLTLRVDDSTLHVTGTYH